MQAARPFDERPRQEQMRAWARKNLFSSRLNTGFTLVASALLAFMAYQALRFALVTADWEVIEVNRRLIFLGRFPSGEEWRIWPPLWFAAATGGLSWGLWSRLSRRDALWLAAGLLFVFVVLAEGRNALLLAVAPALAFATYALGQGLLRGSPREVVGKRLALVAAVLVIPVALIIISGFGGPPTRLWGGLMLNVLVASVAMVASIPVGIGLALGRASSYRSVKYACVGFIEFWRAGPIVVWLLLARFVLPDFLPGAVGEVDLIIRAVVVFTLFTSAYIAEIVRGGLQSVPRGQVEAAQALGVGTASITALIALPQALRAVIPALVGQLIALWKDTSLVTIIALFDALDSSRKALIQEGFTDNAQEAFVFAGLLFWAVAFTMSRLSMRIERNIGIGQR